MTILRSLIWAVLAGSVGYGYSVWAVTNGYHVPVSGITMSLSLLLVAIVLVVLVFPIWKYKRNLKESLSAKDSKVTKIIPVDPFYAVRVLLLTKSTALTAALFIGWHAGVLLKQFTSPVIVQDGIFPNLAALIASVVLLVLGFIIQEICKLPNDDSKANV